MRVNTSDRKIVDTASDGTESAGDGRVPEVSVSGVEIGPPLASPGDAIGGGTDTIGIPRNIEVESQTVRVQPDGSSVIDVVLSYEPAEDAVKHEVRISSV